MNKSIHLFCCILLLLVSCKTLSIHPESQTKTIEPLVLGSIGSGKEYILQKGFNNTSYPTYKVPIKVSVLKASFNKSTYKSFLKAKNAQSKGLNILYTDSLKDKPYYIKLQIADRVSLVHALNTVTNNDVKDYLSINPYANVITGLSIALSQEDFKKMEESKSIFLVEQSSKVYALRLHNSDSKTEIIPFSNFVIFEYNASNCCWQENKKHQLNIVDLVKKNNNCPNKTYRSANKAKKKINYYKL